MGDAHRMVSSLARSERRNHEKVQRWIGPFSQGRQATKGGDVVAASTPSPEDGPRGREQGHGALASCSRATGPLGRRQAEGEEALVHCPESSMPTLGSVPSGAWEDENGIRAGAMDGQSPRL